MHESDSFRLVDSVVGIRTGIEPSLQIGIGNDTVINSIAVLLFLLGLENVESAGYQYGICEYCDTVGKYDVVRFIQAVYGTYVGISEALDSVHLGKQALEFLLGRDTVREQSIPR